MSQPESQITSDTEHASSWPNGYWESVYGSLTDQSFEVPDELDPSLDRTLVEFWKDVELP